MAKELEFNSDILGASVPSATDIEFQQNAATEAAKNSDRGVADQFADVAQTGISMSVAKAGVNKALTSDNLRPLMNHLGVGTFTPEPMSQDEFQAALESRQVPLDRWDYLGSKAVSKAHLNWLLDLEDQRNAATGRMMNDGGFASVGGVTNFGISLFDPVSFAATLGTGAVVNAGAKGVAAATGIKAVTAGRPGMVAGAIDAAGGNVAVGAVEANLEGLDYTLGKAAQQAAEGVGLYAGFKAAGAGVRKLIGRVTAGKAKRLAEEQGAEFNEKADTLVHGEVPPQNDPNFKKADAPLVEPRVSRGEDLVDPEVDNLVSAPAVERIRNGEKIEAQNLDGLDKPLDYTRNWGSLSAKVSNLADDALFPAFWSKLDAAPVKLRFVTEADRALYYLSFKPDNADELLAKVRERMPYATDEMIAAEAKILRENVVRPLTAENGKMPVIDMPNYISKRVGQTLVGTGLMAAGTGVAEAGNGDAEDSALSVLLGTGAVMAGFALIGRRANKRAQELKAANAGKVNADGVPVSSTSMLRTVGDALPVTGKLAELPINSEYHAIGAGSKSDTGRRLNSLLMSSTAGNADRSAADTAAAGLKNVALEGFGARLNEAYTVALGSWAKANNMSTVALDFRAEVLDKFHKEADRYKLNPELNDDPAMRAYTNARTENMARELRQAKALVKQAEEIIGAELPADSPAKVLSNLENRADYVHRMVNHEGLRNDYTTHGEELFKAYSLALQKADAEITLEQADSLSRLYVELQIRMESDPSLSGMLRVDPKGLIDKLVASKAIPAESSEQLLGMLQANITPHAPGITRYRIRFDEDYVHTYKDANGVEQVIELTDHRIHDASITDNVWAEQLHGNLSLLKAGLPYKKDLSDERIFEAMVVQAEKEGATPKEIEHLRAGWMFVKGDAGQTNAFGEPTKLGGTIRAIVAIVMGKDFVFSAIPEGVSTIFGAKLARATRRSAPGLVEVLRAITNRPINDPVLREIAGSTGLGAEGLGSVPRFQAEHGLDVRVNRTVQVLGNKVFKGNGLTGVNNLFEAWNARGFIQLVVDHANGVQKLDDGWIEKTLNPLGMSSKHIAELTPLLKKHVEVDSRGILTYTNLDKMQAENPLAMAQFITAMRKYALAKGSKSADVGGQTRLLKHESTRFLFQFMSTAMFIQNKLLRDVGNFNSDVAAAWLSSYVAASVSYTARTYLNYGSDEEELQKRLALSEIFKSAFRGSIFSGLTSTLADAGARVILGRSIFDNQTTRGTSALTPPVLGLGSSVVNAAGDIGAAVRGETVTKGQARRDLKLLQMGQFWLTPAIAFATEDMPDRVPKAERENQ